MKRSLRVVIGTGAVLLMSIAGSLWAAPSDAAEQLVYHGKPSATSPPAPWHGGEHRKSSAAEEKLPIHEHKPASGLATAPATMDEEHEADQSPFFSGGKPTATSPHAWRR